MHNATASTPAQAEQGVDGTVDDDHPHRPHPKRRRRLLISLALLVIIPVGGWTAWGWLREDAEPVSLADAALRFDREHPGAKQGGGPLQPGEGVYEYRGTGSDHISVPPLTQAHGPGMPGTVTHGDGGCWTFRIDYSSNHWQDWTYCPKDGGLDETAGRTFQRWDLGFSSVDNHSGFTCTSPTLVVGMQAGDTWRQSCVGGNDKIEGRTRSVGTMRFVGVEGVRVGKETVPAYHLVQRRRVSGSQRGTLRADIWFAPDGLPLRQRHTVNVATGSPIGDIDYEESTDFSLVSLQPQG